MVTTVEKKPVQPLRVGSTGNVVPAAKACVEEENWEQLTVPAVVVNLKTLSGSSRPFIFDEYVSAENVSADAADGAVTTTARKTAIANVKVRALSIVVRANQDAGAASSAGPATSLDADFS